jgi:holo-[acyl-carrier protein] synthase
MIKIKSCNIIQIFMIIGIGIDLISNQRVKSLLEKQPSRFINKIFTSQEIIDFKQKFGENFKINNDNINFFAKKFACKEAFSKAIGTGIGRGIDFKDIEIFNNELGKPHIRIINDKLAVLEKIIGYKNLNIHLTISDEKSISIAMVIIEKI